LIEKTALIVSSCDAFSDAWKPFFVFFDKYWADCPYEIYLISNEKKIPHNRVKTICVGKDRGWAANLRIALETISADHVIYFQEDYFIRRRVENDEVADLVAVCEKTKAACLRLYPCPGPDLPFENYETIGLIAPMAPFRVSLQCAIWNKRALATLLVPDESGWDMEIKGSDRSRKGDDLFLSVKRTGEKGNIGAVPIDYVCTAIVKGKWTQEAVDVCKKEGIRLDLSRRPLLKGRPYQQKRSIGRFLTRFFKHV
jgi:hypothetical protein